MISSYPPQITNDRSNCVSAGNLFTTEINDFTATVNQDRQDQLDKWTKERDNLDRWLGYYPASPAACNKVRTAPTTPGSYDSYADSKYTHTEATYTAKPAWYDVAYPGSSNEWTSPCGLYTKQDYDRKVGSLQYFDDAAESAWNTCTAVSLSSYSSTAQNDVQGFFKDITPV